MKKLLLVAATNAEISQTINYLMPYKIHGCNNGYISSKYEIHILITGVGMMQTAYTLANHLAHNTYDAAVQAGIAGAFDKSIKLSTVLFVTSEQYGDLGAEDSDEFISVFDLGFLNASQKPFSQKELKNIRPFKWAKQLPAVKSISVNLATGRKQNILKKIKTFNCDIENMEGIAFHYTCLLHKIPFAQIRSISNYVQIRDKSKWNLKESIDSLNDYLINCIENK